MAFAVRLRSEGITGTATPGSSTGRRAVMAETTSAVTAVGRAPPKPGFIRDGGRIRFEPKEKLQRDAC